MSHSAIDTQPQRIVPQWVGGWVGRGGWLHTEVVCPAEDGHPSKYQPTDSATLGDRTYEVAIENGLKMVNVSSHAPGRAVEGLVVRRASSLTLVVSSCCRSLVRCTSWFWRS